MGHVGGSIVGCLAGVGKLYRPPPSIRLIISHRKVRWMYSVEMYVQVPRPQTHQMESYTV